MPQPPLTMNVKIILGARAMAHLVQILAAEPLAACRKTCCRASFHLSRSFKRSLLLNLEKWELRCPTCRIRSAGVTLAPHLDTGYNPWMISCRDSMVRGTFVDLRVDCQNVHHRQHLICVPKVNFAFPPRGQDV